MYSEDELLPISALQHLEFCPRRCALVHVEGAWSENAMTAEGRVLHQKVHEAPSETVAGVRVVRGLRLCSREFGLFGIADVVEFHRLEVATSGGIALPKLDGRWRAYPVEYKRGRRKSEKSYFVQLCAQALCLEEMLSAKVPVGALYHGQSRRRQEVTFDDTLRRHTRDQSRKLHELISAGRIPPPEYSTKCRFCSLSDRCVPKLPRTRSAHAYMSKMLSEILGE